jgi:endonuclease YncB( thermonuclease family)
MEGDRMKVWKLLLIGISILGVILSCGCMEGGSSSKQVEVQGHVTTTTSGGQTPTLKPTTNEKVEGEKQTSQNSQVGGKLPLWAEKYLPPDAKNYTYNIWRIIKVENDGITCKAEFIESNIKNGDYHPEITYTVKFPFFGDAVIITPTKDGYNAFLKNMGVNLYKVLTNDTLKQKYEEKYKEYLKIANDSLKWERSELEGKELVFIYCPLDVGKYYGMPAYWGWYIISNDGKDLKYEALKRGYTIINEKNMKGIYQNAIANNYTETANYLKKYLDAQEYAKEHKLGVWSIDLSDLKTN